MTHTGDVVYRRFPKTPEGVIQSHVFHYRDEDLGSVLTMWQEEAKHTRIRPQVLTKDQVKRFCIGSDSKIHAISCGDAWNLVTDKEQLYAYHMLRASYAGQRICYFQKSYEAPLLFYLLQSIFRDETPLMVKLRLKGKGWTEE